MIILNGRNFFPQDLEECVLQNVPGLEQNGAAAFGIDSDAGERLVMVFETRLPATAHEATLAAIRRSLSEEFDISPCAVVLCKRHGVPKTTSGKNPAVPVPPSLPSRRTARTGGMAGRAPRRGPHLDSSPAGAGCPRLPRGLAKLVA